MAILVQFNEDLQSLYRTLGWLKYFFLCMMLFFQNKFWCYSIAFELLSFLVMILNSAYNYAELKVSCKMALQS